METEKQMKVGIVTEPLIDNYGGVLQNYALQKTLIMMGHSPVTFDYLPSLSFGRYLLYLGKNLLLSVVPAKRKHIKPYYHFIRRPEAFQCFVDKYINVTRKVEHYSSRLIKNNKMEALIVGSDQVWRKGYNPELEDMFLKFAQGSNCRKLAYAASFGVEEWEYPSDLTDICKDLAASFGSISVREESGVKMCREYLSVDAELVLDPTLLLRAEDYDELLPESGETKVPYLAAYVLDKNEKKDAFINELAFSKGLAVRYMTVSSESGCSIEEWLSTIRNASFVVTDSFHGSVFSVIYKKQFVSFVNKERGADRFYSTFGRLGLLSRLIEPDGNVLISRDSAIDYDSVYQSLENLRRKSLDYLSKALLH